ncbi:hypothetical protein LTR86_003990 [Recurvomyces mirabilis]|nr:hypothetical protein LTR86_003990 [Recurvomyces mirabilis]
MHDQEEKPQHMVSEHIEELSQGHGKEPEVVGFVADTNELPPGYFRSKYFLGSLFATGMGLLAAVGQFGYAAPVLGIIDADLGPDPNFIWISLIYNVALSVFLPIVGRLSDIFGRRWFFIAGAVVGVVGTILCATAKSINMLIVANAICGFANATQLSFHVVMGELVPIKHRYLINAILYVFCIPGSGFGGIISYSFAVHYPSISWRGPYWILVGINAVALVLWALFYFPPTFDMKHKDQGTASKKAFWIKNYDYVGTILFTIGFVMFLIGLNWGGSVYPWTSGKVIGMIVGGFAVLVGFVLYEIYMPLKAPFMPMHLFRNVGWVVASILLGIGAGVYYAFAIIFPTQSAVLYGNGDMIYVGWLSCIPACGIICGQIFGGVLGKRIGKVRYQCMVMFLGGGAFLGSAAVINTTNKNTEIALVFLGCWFIGWNETICLANATIIVHDQQEIGVAGGVAGSIRGAISAISLSVYSAVLTNRLTKTVASEVPTALVGAGLPVSSVPAFLKAITAGTAAAFQAVPGISAEIIATGLHAYKVANAQAYSTVYLTVIAFAGLGFVLTFFAANTEGKMLDSVAATLHGQEALADEKDKRDVV